MDVLSDVLLAVRLTGAVFFDVDARAPFAAESPALDAIAERVMAGAGHVIAFHVLTEGSCWAEAIGRIEPAVQLHAGQIVVFPFGDANVMASSPGMRATPDETLYYRPANRLLPFPIKMNRDTKGPVCRYACGFLGCDARPFNPLLDALPRILRAPVSEASWRWLAELVELVDLALRESGYEGAGREAKLAELMFVEVVRSHMEALSEDARGWLAGLREPHVGAALALIHGRPAEAWTLDALAREVGLSRSSLAERFTAFVRVPPMQYLARWRLLDAPGISIAQAAAAVGYQSEAAFNRAFKRHTGSAPGAWRRQRSALRDEGMGRAWSCPRPEPGCAAALPRHGRRLHRQCRRIETRLPALKAGGGLYGQDAAFLYLYLCNCHVLAVGPGLEPPSDAITEHESSPVGQLVRPAPGFAGAGSASTARPNPRGGFDFIDPAAIDPHDDLSRRLRSAFPGVIAEGFVELQVCHTSARSLDRSLPFGTPSC